MTIETESRIEKLERENRILTKRLARSEDCRVTMEESKERYETLYRSVIRELDEQKALLSEKNQMLEILSGKLSKYLSPQVYSSIFKGSQAVEIASRRKILTVLFSDIVDFTETTDVLEPEILSDILNIYLTEMSNIALKYGATIDKYIGDAIVLFFGDPETRGTTEDAMACVSMAVAMQNRMRELEDEWRNRGLERPFQTRIGISTGYCTVGNFGSQDRMEYTIIGRGVNLAARLQACAEPGGILMTHETYSLAKEIVMAEEQPPLAVKGFDKPIHCYRVVGSYDDLVREGKVIREEQDGLSVLIDLSKWDKPGAVSALEKVLAQLKRR